MPLEQVRRKSTVCSQSQLFATAGTGWPSLCSSARVKLPTLPRTRNPRPSTRRTGGKGGRPGPLFFSSVSLVRPCEICPKIRPRSFRRAVSPCRVVNALIPYTIKPKPQTTAALIRGGNSGLFGFQVSGRVRWGETRHCFAHSRRHLGFILGLFTLFRVAETMFFGGLFDLSRAYSRRQGWTH